MKRMHVMLAVRDLQESVRFYTALFGAEPTVRKADYAKWMLEDPRVNFSIGNHGDRAGLEHLGIEAETSEELAELRDRIGRTGGRVEHEGEVTCCYARSDKSWVVDGQGVTWEAFHTQAAADTYHNTPIEGTMARADGCCAPDCCGG